MFLGILNLSQSQILICHQQSLHHQLFTTVNHQKYKIMKIKHNLLNLFVPASLLIALPAYSATIHYSFDTVTKVNMHHKHPSISGIEKDTGNVLTVDFVDFTSISFRYVVNRCVPVFLTALEKPGKYYLHLSVDTASFNVALRGCSIEVKN